MDNTSNKDLYEYLKKEMRHGKIDFGMRATKTETGIDLNIHPLGANGETIDFSLSEIGDEICLSVKNKTEWNKSFKIIINAVEHIISHSMRKLHYEDIITLAELPPSRGYSVTYRAKLDGDVSKEGILNKDQSVEVCEGMVFNAVFIP